MNNYFEGLLDLQKSLLEKQNKLYGNLAKDFNFNFWAPDYFKNLKDMNFYGGSDNYLKNYLKFQEYILKYYRDFFGQFKANDEVFASYKKNLDFINKIFKAYYDLYKDPDLFNMGNKLVDLYRVFNNQLVDFSKNNIERFIPENFYQIIANLPFSDFSQAYINNYKNFLDFISKSWDKSLEFPLEDLEKFYKEIPSFLEENQGLLLNEEMKENNKKFIENYFNLIFKIFDFNLYLIKALNKASLEAQKTYLDKFEVEEGIEDFSDFYKFYADNLADTYKNLLESEPYKEKSKELENLFKENRLYLDKYNREIFKNFPLVSQADFKEYLQKLEELSASILAIEDDKAKNKEVLENLKKDLGTLKTDFKKFKESK